MLSLKRMRIVENANFISEPAGVLHPDRRMKIHDMLYTISGKREIIEDGVRYDIASGDVLFLAAGRHHWAELKPRMQQRVMYLHFTGDTDDCVTEKDDAAGKDAVFIPSLVRTGGNIIIRKLFEEIIYLSWSSRQLKKLKANMLLGQMLIELASIAKASGNSVAQPIEYVIERIERTPEKNESLDEIADRVGMNRKMLTRHFRKATGQSLNEYRMRVKITNAISLLSVSPETPVRDIAEKLGFYDEYHFSRAFKSVTGKSPSAYRKEVSGK